MRLAPLDTRRLYEFARTLGHGQLRVSDAGDGAANGRCCLVPSSAAVASRCHVQRPRLLATVK